MRLYDKIMQPVKTVTLIDRHVRIAAMNTIVPEWLLIFLGLGAICLELFLGVSTGFDLVIVGGALVVGGIVGVLMGSWQVGLTVAIVLAVAYLLAGRTYLQKSLSTGVSTTNTDRLIGKMVLVTKKITASRAGQVTIDGETWRAVADTTIEEGKQATIVSVEGVTVKVVESGK